MARSKTETCVVFGGTGAVGGAIVSNLLNRPNCRIIATYHRTSPNVNGEILWIPYDVIEGDGNVVAQAVLGLDEAVSAVFFCVGIPSSKLSVVDTLYQEWEDLFRVNCLGFVRAYVALEEMTRKGRASVVILSSDTTRLMRPGNGAYTASKAALEATVHTLAREEAAFGVRVNALSPSLISSPLAEKLFALSGIADRDAHISSCPWGRLLSLEEVAGVAVTLALDPAWSYATGQVMRLAAVQ